MVSDRVYMAVIWEYAIRLSNKFINKAASKWYRTAITTTTKPRKYEENYKCYGKEPRKDDRYIKIIYSKLNSNTLKVITVMIIDIGGLRASGFNNL
jgi:hypothetical protein